MRSRLKLLLLDRAGSVERVLRVARHRGFSLREFSARQGERGLSSLSHFDAVIRASRCCGSTATRAWPDTGR